MADRPAKELRRVGTMSATAKFVEDHPFLTFFLVGSVISGIVEIAKAAQGQECLVPREPVTPGNTRVSLCPRFPFLNIEQAPEMAPYSPWEDPHSPLYGVTVGPSHHHQPRWG